MIQSIPNICLCVTLLHKSLVKILFLGESDLQVNIMNPVPLLFPPSHGKNVLESVQQGL